MPKILWVLTGVAVLAVAGYIYVLAANPFTGMPEGDGIVCTADAMLCPDGSYVGRTGPNCEFVCPQATSSPSANSKTITFAIGESAETLDVFLQPLQILEDSRCPIDVQCIQAGTVRVRVSIAGGLGLGKYTATLTLGVPLTTEAEQVTLVDVTPAPKATVQISPAQYKFVFKIEKRTLPQ